MTEVSERIKKMGIEFLGDLFDATDRHSLAVIQCDKGNIDSCISSLEKYNIKTINVGKDLALFITKRNDYSFLNLDAIDYLKSHIESNKTMLPNQKKEVVAIRNLGILLEHELELKPSSIIKQISQNTALLIIWEYSIENFNRLMWPTQQNIFFLDFTETPFKKLHYAI